MATPGDNIAVVVRAVGEQKHDAVDVDCALNAIKVGRGGATKEHSFNKVFGTDATNNDIFELVGTKAVDNVIQSYDHTIMAYGPTGSGKSFTLFGSEEDPGLLGFIGTALFQKLQDEMHEYAVRVSALEILDENLSDIFGMENAKPLRVYKDVHSSKGICVHNLTHSVVRNVEELQQAVGRVREARASAEASRSHAIVTVTVHFKESAHEEENLQIGRLTIVDLAGAENARGGAVNGKFANQSLLTLGRVITSLVNGTHVPYRESKLTRLLQDSLGGKAQVSLIANIATSADIDQIGFTLEYASKAKGVVNRPVVNRKSYKTLVQEHVAEIASLQARIKELRTVEGCYFPATKLAEMQEVEEAKKAQILDLEETVRKRSEELEEIKAKNAEVEKELALSKKSLCATQSELLNTKDHLIATTGRLKATTHNLQETQAIVAEHVHAEKKLLGEAGQMTATLEQTVKDVDNLHSKLDRIKGVEEENKHASDAFRSTLMVHLQAVDDKTMFFKDTQRAAYMSLQSGIGTFVQQTTQDISRISSKVNQLAVLVALTQTDLTSATFAQRETTAANMAAIDSRTESHLTNVDAEFSDFACQAERVIESMRSTLAQQAAETEAWGKATSERVSVAAATVNTFATEQTAALQRLDASIQENTAEHTAAMEQQKCAFQQLATSQKAQAAQIKEQFMSDVKGLLSGYLSQQQASVASAAEGFVAEATTISAGVEQLAAEAAPALEQAVARGTAFQSSFETTTTDATTTNASYSGNARKQGAALSQDMMSLNDLTDKQSQHLGELVRDHCTDINARAAAESAVAAKSHDEMATAVQEMRDGVTDMHGECSNDLSGLRSASEDSAQQWLNTVSVMSASLDQHKSTRGLDEVKESTLILARTIRDDVPTGHTPAKREYQRPATLTRARPHEDIKADVRAQREAEEAVAREAEAAAVQAELKAAQKEATPVKEVTPEPVDPSPKPLGWGAPQQPPSAVKEDEGAPPATDENDPAVANINAAAAPTKMRKPARTSRLRAPSNNV